MSSVPLDPVLQHMGPVHGFEAVLFYLLAFGPFVALAATVVVVRRRDRAAEAAEHDAI